MVGIGERVRTTTTKERAYMRSGGEQSKRRRHESGQNKTGGSTHLGRICRKEKTSWHTEARSEAEKARFEATLLSSKESNKPAKGPIETCRV